MSDSFDHLASILDQMSVLLSTYFERRDDLSKKELLEKTEELRKAGKGMSIDSKIEDVCSLVLFSLDNAKISQTKIYRGLKNIKNNLIAL